MPARDSYDEPDDILTISEVAGLLKVAEKDGVRPRPKRRLACFQGRGAVAVSSKGHRCLDRGENPGCWSATCQ